MSGPLTSLGMLGSDLPESRAGSPLSHIDRSSSCECTVSRSSSDAAANGCRIGCYHNVLGNHRLGNLRARGCALCTASVPIGTQFGQLSADDVLDEDRDEYLYSCIGELVGGFVDPPADQRGLLWGGVAGQAGKPLSEFFQRTRLAGVCFRRSPTCGGLDGGMRGDRHGLCGSRKRQSRAARRAR